jgi:protein gp37
MALGSGIEWTESTWNPVTGCNKISPGCKYCYAERMAERLQAMGQPNYKDGFKLTLQPKMLELPLQWKKPQTVFVNSMSDLFHKDVPLEYIQRVFDVMRRAHWHRFQVLTKRADRLADLSPAIDWPENVWMGVSVENADYVDRIDDLRKTGAHVKFLSLEPLLGPLPKLKLKGIDWVIVGGESGPRARHPVVARRVHFASLRGSHCTPSTAWTLCSSSLPRALVAGLPVAHAASFVPEAAPKSISSTRHVPLSSSTTTLSMSTRRKRPWLSGDMFTQTLASRSAPRRRRGAGDARKRELIGAHRGFRRGWARVSRALRRNASRDCTRDGAPREARLSGSTFGRRRPV